MMLFASIFLDREPMQWRQMPEAIAVWLQNAGGVAALGIALVLLAGVLSRDTKESPLWNLSVALRPLRLVLMIAISSAGVGYALLLLAWLGDLVKIPGAKFFLPRASSMHGFTIGDLALSLCGAGAIFVAVTPIAFDLATRIRLGRIWAIARLSWKEAIRGRVIWVFAAMALVFLFADWFVSYKPENQLRNYVRVVYWSMTPLFLLTAGLLGSFSIPNDVKNYSIHTIVTKPVEKFEIVLGRFLGYAGLLTIGLFVVACVSLIYVVRGVNEHATKESYRARVPIYGKMHFEGTKDAVKGINVGREWSYRGYIGGDTPRHRSAVRQYAIWDFAEIPADLLERTEPILFEFAFDVFRLSKGETEGKGVPCTFSFTEGARESRDLEILTKQMKDERELLEARAVLRRDRESKGQPAPVREQAEEAFNQERVKIDRDLMEKYRIYQANIEVTDFHTQDDIRVPPGVLKALLTEHAKRRKDDPLVPAMRVFVSVDTSREAQMVGAAAQDFYLLAYELPFWQNFLKGVLGMWCTHMLVLGVALVCSTYLSSVVSFLGTMFLYVTGINIDYLKEIADKKVDGGGPAESLIRITNRMPIAAKLDESPSKTLVGFTDDIFSWWIGRVLNMIPDISRHDLHPYVANGFDISWLDLLFLDNALPLVGYLLPWAIVGYYLMKYREIGDPS